MVGFSYLGLSCLDFEIILLLSGYFPELEAMVSAGAEFGA